MAISAKSRADSALAATRTTKNPILEEIQEVRQERAEQVAKLRALRLAKEAADKQAAAKMPLAGTQLPAMNGR